MNNIDYFIELRKRFLNCLFIVLVVFCILCAFSRDLYDWLTIPLIQHLPESKLIAIGIVSPLLAPFKLSLVLAIFIAVPYILYHFWSFTAPALYRKEKNLLWLILFISTFLFFCGVAFAYWLFLPSFFKLIVHFAPHNVEVKPDINQFLSFILKMFFIFGCAFEIPLIVYVLTFLGITNIAQLKRIRPYIIVGAFVVGMLLTPPDVISQVMLAIPLWGLYELGIFFSLFQRKWLVKDPREMNY
jgi:sec-independent protein translocase protein TatC